MDPKRCIRKMFDRYPRDLSGYGANPPDPAWPDNARIAVQFVVNYEEGGENSILHGDVASEAFLSEITGAAPWPGMRNWNMESIYEYGARAGFWRLHRLFDHAGIPVTVFGVATALARSPEQVAAMAEANWEIASHGLKWIDYKDFSPKAETEHMIEAIALHQEVTGQRPRGWYTGRCSINSVDIIAREGKFAWCADTYADDLPYWYTSDDSNAAPLLMVPYTLDANDMRFAITAGFSDGEAFFVYLRDSFDVLYAEGLAGSPKMMSIGLHCRLAGRPGRLAALKRFIDHIDGHEGVWLARRIDIAEHWCANHPYHGQTMPSNFDRATLVETFGGVFEHSSWVAERAFDAGLATVHDSAIGLHNALCRQFRTADREKQLQVLRAHPDLAGKLAAANRLTEASTNEQASAGLDSLSAAEHAAFSDLNQRYIEKFTFPFIMAVKGLSKDEILNAFSNRIDHDPDTEFATACSEVEKIALLRLKEILP